MYEELVSRLRNTLTLPPFACATMNEAADAIESLDDIAQTYAETVQELKMKSQWIPVTERLPEKEDEAVIVWEKQGFALIDWRHDNKWAILDNNCGIATHWTPLPEPPKDGA